ncbi:MAG: ArdC family protein [Clostridia bacterium]
MEEIKNYTTVDDLIKQAEQQFKQFIQDGKYKDILLSMSNLNCYSITNQLLILSQLPNARCVNGMKVWNYNHRNIKKGEKAIKIIAPLREIKKEDITNENGEVIETKETELMGYKVAYVFDLTQTEGKELYEFVCNEQMAIENFDVIKEALERTVRGFKIDYIPIQGGLDGYCDFTNHQIVIREGMGLEQTLTTLIHEIGHALAETRVRNNFKGLMPVQQKKIKEIEAESIALVVSNKLGLNTTDFNLGYIATFSDGDIEKFKSNLDVIRSVSYQILSSVEPALQGYLREKELSVKNDLEVTCEEVKEETITPKKLKSKKTEVEQC